MKLHVIRRLLRQPGFTAVTILTLAVGIGANSAIFAVINSVLLKPLPYAHSEELVDLAHTAPGVNLQNAGSAPFLYLTYRDESRTLQDIGLWRNDDDSLTGIGEPEQLRTLDVTEEVLAALRVQPLLGRPFSKTDTTPGNPETVIVSYGFWQSKFGGDPNIVGRGIILDGRPREIIGVLPRTFRFLDQKPALLIPLRFDPAKTFLGNFSYSSIARLKHGATLEQANADVARMVPDALHRFPPFPGYTLKMFEDARLTPALQPLKQSVLDDVGKVLWVLMGTVGIVLLIACANVVNLMFVRAQGRQHELAIRAAIGADRWQVARELLIESLTVGVIGGIAGFGLSYAALRLLVFLAPANLPRLDEISLDVPTLLFTFALSLGAGALFGVILSLRYAAPEINLSLRAGARSMSHSREHHRARNTLVVVQIALALVLLVSSGLMIRTFQSLRHVDPGFSDPDHLLAFGIYIPAAVVKEPEALVRMQQKILERIAAVPGVVSAGMASFVPMTGNGWTDPLFAEDHTYAEGQLPALRRFKMISPGLLKTIGNRLLAGRDFTWTDVYEQRRVALVSESLARDLWSEPQAAIGKRIRESLNTPWREIIGVVNDERDDGVDHPAPSTAFFPQFMDNFSGDLPYVQRGLTYIVRSNRAGSSTFVNEISRAVWSVNPSLPLASVRTVGEVYNRSMATTSFALVMLSIAAATALVLGVAGIYGAVSYSVSQRTREVGIRRALGARNAQVAGMFVGQAARLALLGIAFGLLAAVGVVRLMSSLLFSVTPTDPVTYIGVALLLAIAAIMAAYVPALRATSVDPLEALRTE
jgi:putative ABC transport system permease protein